MALSHSSSSSDPAILFRKSGKERECPEESNSWDAPAEVQSTQQSIKNAFTVDVEDYFHVTAFSRAVSPQEWPELPKRVEANTERLLALLRSKKTKATFFVLGCVAQEFPGLIKKIASEGHELASHSFSHALVGSQTREQFRVEVRRSKQVLEDISLSEVRGYRAPTFSISESTKWAYEILEEEGFQYSSSVYPIAHDLYGAPKWMRSPYRPTNTTFLEIPISTARVLGRNIPAAGGGYFRLFPYFFSARLIRQINKTEARACNFYCHPWEIDPKQPRIKGISLKAKIRHYLNLSKTEARLERLLDDFQWGRMEDVYLR